MTNALPIKMTIFDAKTHELVYTASSTKKAVIRAAFASYDTKNKHLRGTWIGYIKVQYHKKRNIWNKAIFNNKASLDRALIADTEKPLIKFLKKTGDVEIKYAEVKA